MSEEDMLCVPRKSIDKIRTVLNNDGNESDPTQLINNKAEPMEDDTPHDEDYDDNTVQQNDTATTEKLPMHSGFHSQKGDCTSKITKDLARRHVFDKDSDLEQIAKTCEEDEKCSGFQVGETNETSSVVWFFEGSDIKGDGESDNLCFTREPAPKGYRSISGACGSNVDGKRFSDMSISKAARECNKNKDCRGFDVNTTENTVFMIMDDSITPKSVPDHSRKCFVRTEPHVPDGYTKHYGRCSVKVGTGPNRCEKGVFETAGGSKIIDAKTLKEAVSQCSANDECTGIQISSSQPTFKEFSLQTKHDIQGDTCPNATCFIRDNAPQPTNYKTISNKYCDSQFWAPTNDTKPLKVTPTKDENACMRSCLSNSKCFAWKLSENKKNEEDTKCMLYHSWSHLEPVKPHTGSLCATKIDTKDSFKGFTNVSEAKAIWDKKTVLNTESGVAHYALTAESCAQNCSNNKDCKSFAFEHGDPHAKKCDTKDDGCGVCHLFNQKFESGKLPLRHMSTTDLMITANRE